MPIKRIVLTQILIGLLSNGYALTTNSVIVKRNYQTALTKSPPVIDGLGDDSGAKSDAAISNDGNNEDFHTGLHCKGWL